MSPAPLWRESMRVFDGVSFESIRARLPTTPWRQALDELGDESWRERFSNRRVGYFHLVLGATAAGAALDLGAGSGIVAAILAGYCRRVVAVDLDPQAVEFMRHRFRQDGLDQIDVVQGDALRLPFAPGSFDLIVLNGSLEWLARSAPDRSPQQVQQQVLADCVRLLRPGGRLCLAIENRLNLNFLRGKTPHGERPFVPVLPRLPARALQRLTGGGRFDTYIHTAPGLRRLLLGAGLDRVDLYAALPTYYNPMLVAPLGSRRIAREVFASWGTLPKGRLGRGFYRALSRSGLLKYVCHSFLAVGVKRA